MKKTVIIVALLMLSIANAQKGTYLVAGSFGFGLGSGHQSNGFSEDKSNYFNISPRIGYQYNENWTAGIQTSFSTNNNETKDFNSNIVYYRKSNDYNIGPFIRYSKKLSELFSLNGDLSTVLSFGKSTSSISTPNSNSNSNSTQGFNVGFSPSIYLNIKNNFGLNFGLGGIYYGSSKGIDTNRINTNSNGFNLNFGQSVSIGLSKNF
jgi:hypothetical protein